MRIEAIFCWSHTGSSSDGEWTTDIVELDQGYIDKAGGNMHDALQWWATDNDFPNWDKLAYVGVYNDEPMAEDDE